MRFLDILASLNTYQIYVDFVNGNLALYEIRQVLQIQECNVLRYYFTKQL